MIPETHAGREDLAQIEATVIQIGPSAWRDQPEPWCKEGDAILMSKFAGYIWKGTDGRDYRVINDLDVVAVRSAQ